MPAAFQGKLLNRLLLVLLMTGFASSIQGQLPDQLPDLDVVYIERTPRYPGYLPRYDLPGREGVPTLADKSGKPLTPAQARSIKRWPVEGEVVTFTAHIQNRGNTSAAPCDYAWYLDGKEIARGKFATSFPVGKEARASWRWKWQPGQHQVRFVVDPLLKNRDLYLHNNSREDATDAWSLIWAVDRVTYDGFNKVRNIVGTRSFEDWAQWHIDRMNLLFDVSTNPIVRTDGWKPRVRCDRVVVVDNVEGVWDRVLGPGIPPLEAGYDGAWSFGKREDCTEWAANADWGLIHEWGHQLGLTDEYALDRAGFLNQTPDAGGDPLLIGYLASMSGYMMHGHGPTTFSPVSMAALMLQRDRRRGYYGDYYYCLPTRNRLQVIDRTGKPVSSAKVTFWQDRETQYAGAPVFQGTTDTRGMFILPNRPAPTITTDRGFTQHNNPFGKINVVGPGDVFFIRIEGRGQTEYTWLDIAEMNLAWFNGNKVEATFVRKTNIPVSGAPSPPSAVTANVQKDDVRLSWQPVPGAKGYRVYHAAPEQYAYHNILKTSSTYFAGTLGNGALHRYAVTAVDGNGRESAFSATAGAMHLLRPWGLVVTREGKRLIRDSAYGQAILQKSDGNSVGLVGSVHYHFEGSYDIAIDSKGRILSAKWGDGYDPKPGFRVQAPDLNLVVDHRETEGSEPGHVRKPMGIGSNSKDHIFIADTGNDRVQEFTPDGVFVQEIGLGELAQPMKVAFDKQDRLYVADSANSRIAVYEADTSGKYKLIKSLRRVNEPVYVAVDDRGRIFVSANGAAGVYMFDEKGQQTWKYIGTPEEPLASPRGLAFDGNGNLLIVDAASRRVLSVKLPD